jgi:hypothetical protein
VKIEVADILSIPSNLRTHSPAKIRREHILLHSQSHRSICSKDMFTTTLLLVVRLVIHLLSFGLLFYCDTASPMPRSFGAHQKPRRVRSNSMEMPVTVLRFAPARRRVRAVASVPLLFPLKRGRGTIRHVEKFAVGLVLWDIARLCMPPSSCMHLCDPRSLAKFER